MKKILVWDLPTRLFHWLLAAGFATAWITAGSEEWMAVHTFAGWMMLGLVVFRLVWGFAGNRYARFSSFLFSPKAAIAYGKDVLTGRAKRHIGHNPAGSWAIYLMLLMVPLVVVAGLVTIGAEDGAGPFANMLPEAMGHDLKELHEAIATGMLVLVGVHVLGVIVESRVHKENLALSMITGKKEGQPEDDARRPYRIAGAALLALAVAGAAMFFGTPAAAEHEEHEHERGERSYSRAVVADNAKWRAECSSCHMAFPPAMLPARSWTRMMAEQDKHFGESLGIDPATTKEILAFLQKNAGDVVQAGHASRFARSVPAGQTTQRITETSGWKREHDEVSAKAWRNVQSKANCAACHQGAEKGNFDEDDVRIPKTPIGAKKP